jgi:PAS domain-containing protein
MEFEFDVALKLSILDEAPVIIAFHDLTNTIIWANKAYRQATNLSLKEISG